MSGPPVMPFRWEGDSFVPLKPKLADQHFVVGEVYPLEVREDRSINSHRHYFASVNQAWLNLPEAIGEKFATADHLRKYALIQTGYHDARSIVCASPEEAAKVATFIKPMDEFAVIFTDGPLVNVLTAKSQSVRSMDKRTFQKSKDDVLTYIASMIGTTAGELQRNEAA